MTEVAGDGGARPLWINRLPSSPLAWRRLTPRSRGRLEGPTLLTNFPGKYGYPSGWESRQAWIQTLPPNPHAEPSWGSLVFPKKAWIVTADIYWTHTMCQAQCETFYIHELISFQHLYEVSSMFRGSCQEERKRTCSQRHSWSVTEPGFQPRLVRRLTS